MKKLSKPLLISGFSAGLLFAAASAYAESEKIWTENAPKIVVQASDKNFDYQAEIGFEKVLNTGEYASYSSFEGTVSKQGLHHILRSINIHEKAVLTFMHFEIKDAGGNTLPNCNLMENDLFSEHSTHFNILVDKEGCHFN